MAGGHPVTGLCWLPHGNSRGVYRQVPLQNVRVDAAVYDLCAEVKVQQTYINDLHTAPSDPFFSQSAPPTPLECVYIFPLDEESAVFSFVAELDGVVVEGRVRERMAALAEYNAAIARDRTAMLLDQSSDNIFRIKVGNLEPGSVCTVTLTYLTLLEQEGRCNRLTLPMIIAPKYTPSEHGPTPRFPAQSFAPSNAIHQGYHCHHCLCSPIIGTRHRCDTCAQDLCQGCHLQHDFTHDLQSFTDPLSDAAPALRTTPAPALRTATVESNLRDLTIKLAITMPSPIVSIQCPSHPSETQITHHKDRSSHAATACFHSTASCSLSTDFILLIEQQRCFDPRVLCELDTVNNTAAVSLAFIPPPVDMLSASQIQCELIFLIDCSGSMRGDSIRCVRECMQLLLRSLPVRSHFNIITFGSRWNSMFPSSQAYDDTSLSEAARFISSLEANLGGTEIYPPLLHILSSNVLPAHPRQVFLLTDGQVSNVEQLARLTTQHAASTRLFTFGIGAAVDRLLCKKLARAGRGKCEFVTAQDGGGAGMREKVVRQVARAMQPVLTDVKVDWRQLKGMTSSQGASSASFLQCPSIAPAIFISSRYILHALNVSLPDSVWQQAKEGKEVELQCEITISAQSNHPQELIGHMHHSVVLMGDQITQSRVIHTLAAKERIRELENQVSSCSVGEEKKGLEDEILHLGLRHTLCSSRTSFVAVYNAETGEQTCEEMNPVGNTVGGESYNRGFHHSSAQGFSGPPPRSRLSKSCLFGASQGCAPLAPAGSFLGYAPYSSPPSQPVAQCLSFDVAETGQTRGSPMLLMGLSAPVKNLPGWNVPSPVESATLSGVGSTFEAESFACSLRAVQQSCQTTDLFGFGAMQPPERASFTGSLQSASCAVEPQSRGSSMAYHSKRSSRKMSSAPGKDVGADAFDAGAVDAFDGLIQLQSARGVWQLTPKLIEAIHAAIPLSFLTVTMQSLQALSRDHGVDDAVVGVIVALQLLETHYKHREAEWEMLATKALFFLKEDAKISTKALEDIKESIGKLLGN